MALRIMTSALATWTILVALMVAASGCTNDAAADDGYEDVTINGHTFHLELAADDAARMRGLGGRDSIPETGGMLFLFPEPQAMSFYMKDCLVDIDIIFIDAQGRVTALHRMKKQPLRGPNESETEYVSRLPTYRSGLRALCAIELKSGWIDKLKVHEQDRIELDMDRLKGLAQSTDLGP